MSNAKYRIELQHTERTGIMGSMFTHSKLAFYVDDKPVLFLDGWPIDRGSGEPLKDESTQSGLATLQIVADIPINPYDTKSKFLDNQIVSESNSEREFLQLLAVASGAAKHINSQNVDYSAFGIVNQNCNSATASMLAAMGIKFPDTKDGIIPIGSNNILIRPDFKIPTAHLNDKELKKLVAENLAALSLGVVMNEVSKRPDPYKDDRYSPEPYGMGVARFQLHNPFNESAAPQVTSELNIPRSIGPLVLVPPNLQDFYSDASVSKTLGRIILRHLVPDGTTSSADIEHIITKLNEDRTFALTVTEGAMKAETKPEIVDFLRLYQSSLMENMTIASTKATPKPADITFPAT
jgi:hypothetical protein